MASAEAQYTVFGFDSRVDWKPTVFVDGIPKNRVCSACGLVSAATALLPCNHLLCSRCYDDRVDGECNRCPLDNDVSKPQDTIWSTFTKDNLLSRKIQCWNSGYGCDVLGPVWAIVDHFQECQYHVVTCFRCKQVMAYKELAGHLKTNNCNVPEACTARSKHNIPDATVTLPAQTIRQLRDQLSSLETCCHDTKELIAGQVQVFRERAAADQLLAVSLQTFHNTFKESSHQSQSSASKIAEELVRMRNSTSAMMNTVSEVLVLVCEMEKSLNTLCSEDESRMPAACKNQQQKLDGFFASSTGESQSTAKRLEVIEKFVRQCASDDLDIKDSLKHLKERLNDGVCKNIDALMECSRSILQNTLCNSDVLIWMVEGWSGLKEEAAGKEYAIALAESPKYFYGYFVLPGIKVVNNDENQAVYLCYHVCKGDYDAILSWPFQKKVRLHFINDATDELPDCLEIDSSGPPVENDQMPTEPRNNAVCGGQSVKILDIEGNGYLVNDTLSLKFKVLQL